MREKILNSILVSLEWRLYAFIITGLFLWATTGHLAFAAVQALGLHIMLFVGHTVWYYFRSEGPHAFTLDAMATKLARVILSSLFTRRGE